MKLILLVGAGSFLGGIFRYLLSSNVEGRTTQFPFGTFLVNLIGCFCIGCLLGIIERWQWGTEWRLFLITGLLGGFTTFSAFSAETLLLIKTGNVSTAIFYVLGSIILGVGLAFLGSWIFRFTN